ncbi:MAG: acetylxylan esterase [Planctomycetes bacterium]|nr:acetylxylan esterase [Planctomycetota bacterium]
MGLIEEMKQEWEAYLPPLTKRGDFDSFWEKTLAEAHSKPLNTELKAYDYPSPHVTVKDVTIEGIDGTKVHGWYLVPSFLGKDKYPCIVHYHGFSGNRGRPSDFLQWIMMGCCVVSFDVRGQSGETSTSFAHSNGSLNQIYNCGILDKEEYYLKYAYTDAVREISFACEQPEVDTSKIIIEGGSQGGALTMAMAALDDRPILALAAVPSNTNLEERVKGGYGVFNCVTEYGKKFPDRIDRCFETLSYFDTMNMADRVKCRVVAGVGGKDPICPAKFYYATYNRITSKKEIYIYPLNGHEGGGGVFNEIGLRAIKECVG